MSTFQRFQIHHHGTESGAVPDGYFCYLTGVNSTLNVRKDTFFPFDSIDLLSYNIYLAFYVMDL